MNSSRAMRIVLIASIITLLLGAVVTIAAPPPSTSFGWTAYAPLPEQALSPDRSLYVSTVEIAGFALIAVGCVGLAFWCGSAFATRRTTSLKDRSPE